MISDTFLAPCIAHHTYNNLVLSSLPVPSLEGPTTESDHELFCFWHGGWFPTDYWPTHQALLMDPQKVIDNWIQWMGINIRPAVDTLEWQDQAACLLYTWHDCFAISCTDIKVTDLIKHSINLVPDTWPVKAKLPKYSHHEWEFANQILPEMEAASIIVRMSSEWGACIKFPLKKKNSTDPTNL